MHKFQVCLLVAMITLLPSLAAAQADCDEIIAEIDRRVATGKYPEHSVMMANTIKSSLPQICGLMDESAYQDFISNLE